MSELLRITTEITPETSDIVAGYIVSGAADFKAYSMFDASGDTFEMRTATAFRNEQKENFLNDNIRNPVLNSCPNFQLEQLARRDMYQQTTALMYGQSLRQTDGVEETLEDRVLNNTLANRINELGYIETAALLAESDLPRDEYTGIADILKQAGREIYGLPKAARVQSIVAGRLEQADKWLTTGSDEIQSVARYVKQMDLAINDDGSLANSEETSAIDAETANYYQELLRTECQEALDWAFEPTGTKEEYSPDEMRQIFDRFLQARGYADAGWHAVVVAGRTMCATKSDKLVVEIGADRSAGQRKYKPVIKSLIHEVEVHAGRHVRGSRLGSGLAGHGLAGFEAFEEPFAATNEGLYFGEDKTAGEAYTLGIGLAAGIAGPERDFRDSFEAAWRLALMKTYKPDKPFDEQVTKARQTAYTTQVRIWRGMPTEIPGCIFPKDRAYDNTEVRKRLSKRLPRQDFMRLLVAKYNPFVPDQAAYVESLLVS